MKKKLICNLNFYKQGHHIFYQNILFEQVQYFENNEVEYYFLFNDSDAKNSLVNIHPNTIFLSKSESEKLNNYRQSFKVFFFRWKLIKYYAMSLDVDEVFLMEFDESIILPILFSRFNFKVSGIIFRPVNRFIELLSWKNFRIQFQVLKKILLLKIIKYKGVVGRILILNDAESVRFFKKFFFKETYRLGDPVNRLNNFKNEISKKNDDIFSKKILIFGALSERKNIENLIISLNNISLKNIVLELLIVGKFRDKAYENRVIELINYYKDINHLHIKINNSYINEEQIAQFFDKSDIIFIAYKNFYFSSGIQGIAARAKKISIVPNYGPMADLAREYKLGVPVNPDSVEEIKKGILYCIENQEQLVDTMRSDEFCNTFTHENFAKAILE